MKNYRACPQCGEMVLGWEKWMQHKAECKGKKKARANVINAN